MGIVASVVGPIALVAGIVVLVGVSSWAFSTFVLVPWLERQEAADAERAATQAYIAQLRQQANSNPAHWRPPAYTYGKNGGYNG
jgi:hypothetical protein